MEAPSGGAPFGQYHLTEKIAQGGMAEIFKGRTVDANGLEKTVVIKRILPHIAASTEFIAMLVDEAKIAVQLSHGNIAQIYDLGKVGEDYFIVMEYVAGKSVSQIARRLRHLVRPCPLPVACFIVSEVAAGLDYMHRKRDEEGNPLGIIHRDISPQNIIVSESATIKIIDFGIAKAKTKVTTTDSGVVKGKFAYMSPEHAEGEKLDYRSDIFSLGIILDELLVGQRLFKGKNNAETIRKVKKAKVRPPSLDRPEIPPELDEIVLKALARDREKRYQQAGLLREDLTRLLITHYPDFKPQDLVNFVSRLFAEETPTSVSLSANGEEELLRKEGEETGQADSSVIRREMGELKELEPSASVVKELSISSEISVLPPPYKRQKWLKSIGLVSILGLVLWFLFGPNPWGNHPLEKKEGPPPLEPVGRVAAPFSPPSPPPSPSPPAPSPIITGLVVQSNPPGAKVFIDEAETEWRTPTMIENLKEARHKIGLHLEGYKFWEKEIPYKEGAKNELKAELEINYGGLSVQSLPEGASVYLNDVLVGKTPWVHEKLIPESTFSIKLKLEGYDDFSSNIKVFSGRQTVINTSLKKVQKGERL